MSLARRLVSSGMSRPERVEVQVKSECVCYLCVCAPSVTPGCNMNAAASGVTENTARGPD